MRSFLSISSSSRRNSMSAPESSTAGMSLVRGCRWPTGACRGDDIIAVVLPLGAPGPGLILPASISAAWAMQADPRTHAATASLAPDIIDILVSPILDYDASCVVDQDCGLQLQSGFAREKCRYP